MNDIADLIVIRVDGGICSQIEFVALGLHLKRKFRDAVRVKYDLTWFSECGRDIDGLQVRNWDFPKAFPSVPAEEATAEEIEALKHVCSYCGRDADAIAAPMYVGGYPERHVSFAEQLDFLCEAFRPDLSDFSRKILSQMQSGPCCAVHVRRGDLSDYTLAYGHPATPRYFAVAIKILQLAQPDMRFFFFTDDPVYVRREILTALPNGVRSVVADGNGSDRGFEDMYLIARADFVVTSTGSLGRVGAQLSSKCRCVIGLRRPGQANFYRCEAIFLDDVPLAPVAPTGRCGLSFVRYLWHRLQLQPRRHRRFISLGWNCELAFRYYRRNGFLDSNLFAWGTSRSIPDLTSALTHLDRLFAGVIEGPNPLYECAETHVRLHGKGGLPIEEERADLVARVAHLKEKFVAWLRESEGVLVMYKVRTDEWFEPDIAARLHNLHAALRSLGSGRFTFVIVCEEKCRERPVRIGLPDTFVRYVNVFNGSREVTNFDVGDKWGWRILFDEFRPFRRQAKKHKFKFE